MSDRSATTIRSRRTRCSARAALRRETLPRKRIPPGESAASSGLLPTAPLRSRQQDRVEEQLEGAVGLTPELGPEPDQNHPPAADRCLHQRRFPNEPLLIPGIAGSEGLLGIRRQGPCRARNSEGGAILEVDVEGVRHPERNRAARPLNTSQKHTENRAWGVKSQNLRTRCLTT